MIYCTADHSKTMSPITISSAGLSMCIWLSIILVLVRTLHRIYYFLTGHVFYFSYSPKNALNKFISICCKSSHCRDTFVTHDGVIIEYYRLGSGKQTICLLNGVGTGFFMWLPVLKQMLKWKPDLFETYTLYVPSYRGLFGSTEKSKSKSKNGNGITVEYIDIKVELCVKDFECFLKHLNMPGFDAIIGWSTGAQVALSFLGNFITKINVNR